MNTTVPAPTPFGMILQRAVEATPGAIGGAFADSQGEMVDCYATLDRTDWAILTAHYGVVLAHVNACFGTWHYGSPEYFIAQHATMDIVVCNLTNGYFALLAVAEPAAPLALALASLRAAAASLTQEMG